MSRKHTEPTVGILVHGDNHFIVRGPLPGRATALALVHHWSIIQIATLQVSGTMPPALNRWSITTKEFRENLTWAVIVPGEREITPAVVNLLAELAARGIAIYNTNTMERSGLHLYALLAAFCALLLVMTGAALTSSLVQTKPALNNIAMFQSLHSGAAVAVVLLTIGLAIWISLAEERAWLIHLSWITCAAVIAEAGLGLMAGGLRPPTQLAASGPPTGWLGTLHACLAALVFVAFAAIALATSRTWSRDPELVQDYGWPSNRSLSAATALLVAIQVAFGAAFRHNLVSVMWHLLGALVVALFIMIVGAFVSNQFPKHPTLRPMAVALMVITGIQVFLGMTAFIMRLMESAAATAYLAISVAHVATGSLTFAAGMLLAMEVRRSVRPRDPKPATVPEPRP
jgi:hypothetical protein